MGVNWSKCVQMGPDGSKWVQMGPNGSKWVEIGLNRSKWVQLSPNEFNWVQMDSMGWPLKPGSTWFLFIDQNKHGSDKARKPVILRDPLDIITCTHKTNKPYNNK